MKQFIDLITGDDITTKNDVIDEIKFVQLLQNEMSLKYPQSSLNLLVE